VQKTLIDWVKYEPEVYEVVADSVKKKYKAFLIACGNASQYGNNAYITPYASMRDGLLSVSVMEPFTAVEVPIVVAQLFSNALNKNSHVTTFSTRKLTIKRKQEGPVHYDGEPAIMDAELCIEVVPDGLKVLALPGWDGTCEPMPLHKQFFDAINGTVVVPELNILKLK
jgi:diacylglycerol kinase family enzyme